MNFDKNLKDLIIKLLNPHPQRRIGYLKSEDLINHPYFEGCFDEEGSIKKNKLVKAPFKVEIDLKYLNMNPISYDILLRFDDINNTEQPISDIPDFTHVNQSISKFSQQN